MLKGTTADNIVGGQQQVDSLVPERGLFLLIFIEKWHVHRQDGILLLLQLLGYQVFLVGINGFRQSGQSLGGNHQQVDKGAPEADHQHQGKRAQQRKQVDGIVSNQLFIDALGNIEEGGNPANSPGHIHQQAGLVNPGIDQQIGETEKTVSSDNL
ncbi:hypothetical protein NC99_15800 [Sunxiuqinia dokdonensis]|uniref:Uncharacterized protein n=1 Tax=Sunxiuqinia dokdonensis TaxID=1409788 RepID=A0A0L8VAX0_9BACT|nr:hypothetical protein NC99_15800 [Sunxiuqinia dokdonensis]